MKFVVLTAFCSLIALTLSSSVSRHHARRSPTYPSPEPISGNISQIHDPSIIKRESDGTWFRLSTNGNIALASSPSLAGPWKYLGPMLPNGSDIKVSPSQQVWAPDVTNINGTYYCYYAVSTLGSQKSAIGLATSKTLEPGSWTDHGILILPSSPAYNLIDPNLFHESPDSPYYLSFGSAWDGIFQTQLTSPPTAQNKPTSIMNIAQNSSAITEGSFQFWWPTPKGKFYFLFFSSGVCCNTPPKLAPAGDEYKIEVCRSTSPIGPFVDQKGRSCLDGKGGMELLGSHGEVYAPGGQGVYIDAETMKMPIVYYHYVNTSVGYEFDDFQFGWNYVDFATGWPVVVRGQNSDPVRSSASCAYYRQAWTWLVVPAVAGIVGALIALHC